MHTKKNQYAQLFLESFRLSACTFGGGFVIIPLMHKRFVKELKWIEEQEMLDLTAIAQSTPGAIAVNASILVGYHAAGIPGALTTVLGTTLPPLIIISIISLFYSAFRENTIINLAMTGMLAGVGAVVCDVVVTMVKGIFKKTQILSVIVFIASFIAVRFLNLNIILIILICGIIGTVNIFCQKRERRKKP